MGDHLGTIGMVNKPRPVCQSKQSLINSMYTINVNFCQEVQGHFFNEVDVEILDNFFSYVEPIIPIW